MRSRRSRRSDAHHGRTQPSDEGHDIADGPPGPEPHPLPWRNTPVDGANHLTDVRGDVVYVGYDASEMFRLLAAATARAGSTQQRQAPTPLEHRSRTEPRTP